MIKKNRKKGKNSILKKSKLKIAVAVIRPSFLFYLSGVTKRSRLTQVELHVKTEWQAELLSLSPVLPNFDSTD